MGRSPAVAGLFYPASAREAAGEAGRLLDRAAEARPLAATAWRALLLPHAGWVYSGAVAAAGCARVEWPRDVVLLCPSHTGEGAALALSPDAAWETPVGAVERSGRLAALLAAEVPRLETDARAHAREHAIEVLLPFLKVRRPDVRVACVCVGEPGRARLEDAGRGLARALAAFERTGERAAIIVSSDLSHYLPKAENGRRDRRALDLLLGADPDRFHEAVAVKERISMCGVFPATLLLEALRHLSPTRGEVIAHADSSDAGGDESRVVGYAAVIWKELEAS